MGIQGVRFSAGGEPRRQIRRRRSPASTDVSDDETGAPRFFEPLSGVIGNIEGRIIAGDENVAVLKFQLAPLTNPRKLAPEFSLARNYSCFPWVVYRYTVADTAVSWNVEWLPIMKA